MDIAELRFLVVEVHAFQRWAIGNLLQGLGAKYVFSAADGRAVLEIFRDLDSPIDIVISDLDMPETDGMELIRHMGEAGGHASLILASSLDRAVVASVETMARVYGIRLLGAIEKPFTPKALKALIDLHRTVRHAPSRSPR